MAAIVTRAHPILRTAVDSTATYKGRTMWFGLLCIRLVTVFLAQFPWKSLNEDSTVTALTPSCIKACFNKHFDNSIVRHGISSLSFLCSRSFSWNCFPPIFDLHSRRRRRKKMASSSEQGAVTDPTMTVGGRMMIDLHKSKKQCGGVPVSASCCGLQWRFCLCTSCPAGFCLN